ncbi:MAG TPA: GNAT family N-acetyltransferase [Candidatus Limnocylindrales bacterium]|nr:GNAT family N-acetyltransferase [Candidatus Limnocylindrales bacterium]
MLGNPDHAVGGLSVRPPAGVELRPLGRGDLGEALAMAREMRDLPPLPDPSTVSARWERLVNSADAAPFVATADDEPAGLAVLVFRRRLNFATFEGWLSNLYVRPRFRGRGVGRMLAEAVVAEWRLRQGHRILVQVPAAAEAARATLGHLGFGETMIAFELSPLVDRVVPLPMPDGVTLRPLVEDDFEAVTRLIAQFGPRRSPVPDRMDAMRRTFAMHARAVAAGEAGSLVADLEGSTVGVAIMEWRDPFWDLRRQAWIPDLVVTEPMRGRGIGRALLEHALRAAVWAGASEMVLESGLRRSAAHRLYAAAGFAASGSTYALERDG